MTPGADQAAATASSCSAHELTVPTRVTCPHAVVSTESRSASRLALRRKHQCLQDVATQLSVVALTAVQQPYIQLVVDPGDPVYPAGGLSRLALRAETGYSAAQRDGTSVRRYGNRLAANLRVPEEFGGDVRLQLFISYRYLLPKASARPEDGLCHRGRRYGRAGPHGIHESPSPCPRAVAAAVLLS